MVCWCGGTVYRAMVFPNQQKTGRTGYKDTQTLPQILRQTFVFDRKMPAKLQEIKVSITSLAKQHNNDVYLRYTYKQIKCKIRLVESKRERERERAYEWSTPKPIWALLNRLTVTWNQLQELIHSWPKCNSFKVSSQQKKKQKKTKWLNPDRKTKFYI